jgi:hypothetical protein
MPKVLVPLLFCLAVAGCMSEDVLYYDGVTTAAGDAIAANTAMQLVDPWQAGVEETLFDTPVVRPNKAAGSTDSAKSASTTHD